MDYSRVFHQAGEFVVGKDLIVGVDNPCLVLLNETDEEITISDPTAALKEIKITLNRGDGKTQSCLVKLPAGGFAGKSVSMNMDL